MELFFPFIRIVGIFYIGSSLLRAGKHVREAMDSQEEWIGEAATSIAYLFFVFLGVLFKDLLTFGPCRRLIYKGKTAFASRFRT